MDYMREINAFYDWLETNSLSANAVLTWHALMHVNNKCFWKPEFRVSLSVLALKTGGVSRRSVERARNELAQKGLIQWREMPGNQSAAYSLISIVRHTVAQSVAQSVAQPVAQSVVQAVAQAVAQPVAQAVAQPVAQVDAITSYPSDTRKTDTYTQTKTYTGARELYKPGTPVRRPVREVAQHRYTQRQYTDEELNALFYDPMKEKSQ
jgi:hypothetical protein